MSDENEPGHGNSPAAWVAVTIMLVAFTTGTLAFWFDLPVFVWASAGLLVRRRDRRRRPVEARLRGQGAEVRAQGPFVECSTNSSPGPSPTPRSDALRAASQQVEADALARPRPWMRWRRSRPPNASRSSPRSSARARSRGALADIVDPAALAVSYQTGGASAISVLTEGRRFGGSLDDLEQVRDAVEIPVLRKDFIAEEYQVLRGTRRRRRSRAAHRRGARAARRCSGCTRSSRELGMTALVETHSAEEVERALDLGAQRRRRQRARPQHVRARPRPVRDAGRQHPVGRHPDRRVGRARAGRRRALPGRGRRRRADRRGPGRAATTRSRRCRSSWRPDHERRP